MGATKPCRKCKRELPLGAFYLDRGTPRAKCKECVKAQAQKWRKANPGRVKEMGLFYRLSKEGSSKRKAWLKERARRPSQIEYQKQWAKTEKGQAARRGRVNRFAKTEKGNAANKRRHARRRSVLVSVIATLTADEWREIMEQSGHRCAYCGKPFGATLPPTQDHVIPLSKGGNHTKDNVVPACKPCNSRKKDKLP
jgi:5-methylcytosine-specific restriction endonuclease McrA